MPYLRDADFSCDRIKFGRCGQNIETAFRVNGPQGVFVISDNFRMSVGKVKLYFTEFLRCLSTIRRISKQGSGIASAKKNSRRFFRAFVESIILDINVELRDALVYRWM